ncbi:MAG: YneF family protein [Erysipelotrichales bacterium]|nr:YneF family protein [Erysipelotrichales bacterium]
MTTFWQTLLSLIIGLIVGGALGYYFTRKQFEKQLRENPPINEKMIRAMYMQMGRKPSEAQIKQIMASMNQYRNAK